MRARKVDKAQPAIVDALRAVGASVLTLSAYGVSCDLLVYHRDRFYLVEIKNPGPPSTQRLTTRELELARQFPMWIVTTPSQALSVIGMEPL